MTTILLIALPSIALGIFLFAGFRRSGWDEVTVVPASRPDSGTFRR